jgi:hypothetical protein
MDCGGDVPGVLAALDAALDAVAALDVSTLDDAGVRKLVLGLEAIGQRVGAQTTRAVGVFHQRRLCDRDGFGSTAAWLKGFGRLSGPAAGRQIRAATITGLLPSLDAAWRAGTVNADHVDHIGRMHERLGGNVAQQAESILVPLAEQERPEQVRYACDHITSIVKDGSAHPDPAFDRRALSLSRLDDMWLIRGQLDPESGSIVLAGLAAFNKPPRPGDDRNARQRLADAFTEAFRRLLRDPSTPTVGGAPPQVGVLLPVQMLAKLRSDAKRGPAKEEQAQQDPAGSEPAASDPARREPAWLDRWGPVSGPVVDRILCDSAVFRAVLDPTSGLPLDLGRSYRLCPPWLRKALWARDRGCRWPGCDADVAWTDAHHLRGWTAQRGRTEPANLILLCRHHHVRVHEGGWRIHVDAAGMLSVTRPDGAPYELGPTRPWTTTHQLPGDDPGGSPHADVDQQEIPP